MPLLKHIPDSYTRRKIEYTKKNGLRHAIFVAEGKRLFKGYYKGEWRNDKKEGKGKELDRNGWLYNGSWLNNERHGYGVLSKISNDGVTRQRYVGEWLAGKKHSFGCNWFKDGSYYEGEFAQNKRQGYGCIWYCSGDYYQGTWENDLYHGTGIYVKANGNRYEGQFVEGKKQGHGIFYHIITGQEQRGFWKQDFFINGMMSDMHWRQSAPCPTPYPIPPIELAEQIEDSEVRREIISGDQTPKPIFHERTCKRKFRRTIANVCVSNNTCPCLDSVL